LRKNRTERLKNKSAQHAVHQGGSQTDGIKHHVGPFMQRSTPEKHSRKRSKTEKAPTADDLRLFLPGEPSRQRSRESKNQEKEEKRGERGPLVERQSAAQVIFNSGREDQLPKAEAWAKENPRKKPVELAEQKTRSPGAGDRMANYFGRG